jgi:uncharacterized membrane protein (UPF0127 family)
MQLHIVNETRGQVLASEVRKADNIFSRMRGLLFSPPLQTNQGLLLVPCSGIHCIGMTYTIDAIFIDQKSIVVGLVESIKPWQLSAFYPKALSCLELPAGVINKTGTQLGDQLSMS